MTHYIRLAPHPTAIGRELTPEGGLQLSPPRIHLPRPLRLLRRQVVHLAAVFVQVIQLPLAPIFMSGHQLPIPHALAAVILVLEEHELVFHRAVVREGERPLSNSVPGESRVEKERLGRMSGRRVGRLLLQVVDGVIGERGGRIC